MAQKPFNIPTVDISLYNDYKAGRLTLEECAREFHKCGWDNFVDEEATARRFARIENEHNQYDTTPVTPA